MRGEVQEAGTADVCMQVLREAAIVRQLLCEENKQVASIGLLGGGRLGLCVCSIRPQRHARVRVKCDDAVSAVEVLRGRREHDGVVEAASHAGD